jgi:hypothetical protein
MSYIHCPDCDAIREMDTAACPECGRCANCGEKVDEGVQNCACGFPGDEKLVKWIETRYGIPAESVEKEKAKRLRRKKLAPLMLAGRILLLILCLILSVITGMMLLADSNEITKVVMGVPVVCLLAFFYWIFAIGIVRILFWIGKKIGIGNK